MIHTIPDPRRDDAVPVLNPPRWFVPTTDKTQWVNDWLEFEAAGGRTCFSEDQTHIVLELPAPYKFSCQFFQGD